MQLQGIEVTGKLFAQLSTQELYEILKARSQVFVVEQACLYQDLDDRDQDSLHICLRGKEGLVAYLRAFLRQGREVQVGRVLTLSRGKGYGDILLREGLALIEEVFHPDSLYLEAQVYAQGFYERFGFEACSEVFLEDGIPHVQMRMKW